jgi:hypothetical protein
MFLALLVDELALSMATGRLVFKYSAARRPRRGDILDQRGAAWKWTELSPTFSALDVSTRQANVVCDLPEPRDSVARLTSCGSSWCGWLNMALFRDGPLSLGAILIESSAAAHVA